MRLAQSSGESGWKAFEDNKNRSAVLSAYCDKNTPAVFNDITYGFYKVFAEINNVPYKAIPLKEDFSIDVNDYINEKGTVFIANPNAPTGLILSIEQIKEILFI